MLIVAKSGPISSRCPFGPDGKPISARESELIRGNEHLAHPSIASSRTCCRHVCACVGGGECVCVCGGGGGGGGWSCILTLASSLANSFVPPSSFTSLALSSTRPFTKMAVKSTSEQEREGGGGGERERERIFDLLMGGVMEGERRGEAQTGRQREKDL